MSVVTVGSFDGLHRGHQEVLRTLLRRAREQGAPPVVVTFEPHPSAVLAPERAPKRLTTEAEKAELLRRFGIEQVVVLPFDRALAARTAEEFVREVLLGRCVMKELVIGENHGFGRDRDGNRRSLPDLGSRLGFGVTEVAEVPGVEGGPVSSTGIRAAVAEGRLDEAARGLGRRYHISGVVVHGAERGRTIGVPTINLAGPPPEKALPPDGVYAARVAWDGGSAGAMLNQGPRPTVGEMRRAVEAHLFGVNEDFYGRVVRIEWVERLRDVRRFESLDALKAQLALDRDAAQAILARRPETSTARPSGAR